MTPEERAAYMKRYRKRNKRHLTRYQRRWWKAHREEMSAKRKIRYYTDEDFRQYELERHRKLCSQAGQKETTNQQT